MSDKPALISQASVVLPFAHIIVCFIYLFGYSTGFGSNIGLIFSISDLFGTAVYGISTIYITGALIPFVLLIYMDKTDSIPLIGTTDFINNPDGYERTKNRADVWIFPFALGLFKGAAILYFYHLLMWILFDARFPAIIFQMGMIYFYLTHLHDWIDETSLNSIYKGALWLAISLPIAAFTTGLNAGQTDRRERFVVIESISAHCGPYAIRRPVGDLYLAVTPKQSRILVDKDCKPKFAFPNRSAFATPEEDLAWWSDKWQNFVAFLNRTFGISGGAIKTP